MGCVDANIGVRWDFWSGSSQAEGVWANMDGSPSIHMYASSLLDP